MIDNILKFNFNKKDWKSVKLDDVVREIKEVCKSPKKDGLQYIVGLEHIDSEDIHLRRFLDINQKTTFTKLFRKNHILFGRRRAYLKKAAQAPFDGICSGDITVMEAKEGLLPELLPFLINNDNFFNYAIQHSAGSLSPRVKFKDLANYEFLLPPKGEQAKLAKLLWAADNVVEKDKALLEKLEVVKFRTLKFIFTDGNGSLKLKPFSNYIIPLSWNIKRMEEVSNIEYGISKSVANNIDPNIGWPILTGANIKLKGELDDSKMVYIEEPNNERFFLQKGDLLFNWRSGSPEHIGKTAMFTLDGSYTYASFILRIRCFEEQLNNFYAYYLLNYLREIEYFSKEVAQQVNFKINATIFRQVQIPIPELSEQIKIITKLKKIYDQIDNVNRKLQSSQALLKSLINEVFG